MLFTCISSKLYDGEKTLRDINTEWAKQLHSLFHEGVQAGVPKYMICAHGSHKSKTLVAHLSHTPLRWVARRSGWSGSPAKATGLTWERSLGSVVQVERFLGIISIKYIPGFASVFIYGKLRLSIWKPALPQRGCATFALVRTRANTKSQMLSKFVWSIPHSEPLI